MMNKEMREEEPSSFLFIVVENGIFLCNNI